MRKTILFLCLLSGCGFSNTAMRNQSSMSYDDGVHPVQRMTYTQVGNGSTVSAGLPIGTDFGSYGPGFGYGGYGYGSMLGPVMMNGCSMGDIRQCPVNVTTPFVAVNQSPVMTSAPNGTVSVSAADPQASNLEARMDRAEQRIEKLRIVAARSVKWDQYWCQRLQKNPQSFTFEEGDLKYYGGVCGKILGADETANNGGKSP